MATDHSHGSTEETRRIRRRVHQSESAGTPSSVSLRLASMSIAIRAARASSGVSTELANGRRTGRGPSFVRADISNPYRSIPVMLADVISVAFENALE